MILNKQQIKDIIINAEKVSDIVKVNVSEGNAVVSASNESVMFQGKIDNVEADITLNETYIFDATAINILKNIPIDEVTVERKDGKIKIHSGKYRATVEEPVYNSAIIEQEAPEKVLLIENFSKVRDVAHAAACDEMRPILKGINFLVVNSEFVVGALDGYRVTSKTIKFTDAGVSSQLTAIEDGYTFTIDKDILNKAISICGDAVCMAITKNQIVLQANNVAILVKKMQGEYVNYLKMLDTVIDTNRIIINREALINATNRCNISKKDVKAISMIIKDGVLTVSNSGKESTVEVGEEIDIVGGTDVKISINPKYLVDALSNIDDAHVEIEYTEMDKPIKLEGKDYKIMILPVVNP